MITFANNSNYMEMPYTVLDLACIAEAKSRFQTQHDGKAPTLLLVSPNTWYSIVALPNSNDWIARPIGFAVRIEPLGLLNGMFAGMQVVIADTGIHNLCILACVKVGANMQNSCLTQYRGRLKESLVLLPQNIGDADRGAVKALVTRLQ